MALSRAQRLLDPARSRLRQATGPLRFPAVAYGQPFRRGARMLLAFLLFTVPVTLIGALAALYLLDADALFVNQKVWYFALPEHALAVVVAVGVLAGLALLFGQLVGGLVAVAAVAGGNPTLRWAIRAAVSRVPAALPIAAGQLAALALGVGQLWLNPLDLSDEPRTLASFGAVVVAVVALAMLAPALPVALTEGGGPWRALRRSVLVARDRDRLAWTVGTVLGGGVVVPGVVLAIADLLLVRVVDALAPSPHELWYLVVVGALAVIGMAVFTSVQVTAVLYRGPLEEPADERLDQIMPPRRSPPRPVALAGRAGAGTVLAIVGLLLPGLVGTGLFHANPTGLPRMTRATVYEEASDLRVEAIPMRDDSVVAWSSYDRGVVLDRCAGGRCRDVSDDTFPLNDSAAVVRDGDGLMLAGWRSSEPDTAAEKAWDLVLVRCGTRECPENPGIGDSDRAAVLHHSEGKHWPSEAQVAMRRLPGGGYVVAALVGTDADDHPALTLYRCTDWPCRNPTTTRLDYTPPSFIPNQVRALSVAVTSDGRAVTTVMDAESGLVQLFACESAACNEPVRTVVTGTKRVEAEYFATTSAGVQVAMRSDDRPVVAYRDVSTGATVMAVCDDLACRHPVTRRLTRPGWANPPPSFTLDSQDRPVFATHRPSDLSLVLVNCRDTTCAHRDRVRFARTRLGPSKITVAVDDEDRPVVVWADNRGHVLEFPRGTVSLIHCRHPRCAAG